MFKKWVCCICISLMTLTFFAGAISQEAFADANNQRWIYVTKYYVCPDGTIFTQTTSRTLDTWQDENHPAPTLIEEQVCYPLYGGGTHCEDQLVPHHTSHSVYWHNAIYYSYTQSTSSHACR